MSHETKYFVALMYTVPPYKVIKSFQAFDQWCKNTIKEQERTKNTNLCKDTIQECTKDTQHLSRRKQSKLARQENNLAIAELMFIDDKVGIDVRLELNKLIPKIKNLEPNQIAHGSILRQLEELTQCYCETIIHPSS